MRTRSLSLEYRLPLLITGLLACLVLTGSVFAYREVRGAAVRASADRVDAVAREIAAIGGNGVRTRSDALQATASRPDLVAYLLRPSTDAADVVRELLHDAQPPGDTVSPLELRGLDGTVIASAGRFPDAWTPSVIDSVRGLVHETGPPTYGRLFAVGQDVFLWIVTPVRYGQREVGSLAHLRPIGTTASEQVLSLVGQVSGLYFANSDGTGPWAALGGENRLEWPVLVGGDSLRDADGQAHLYGRRSVPGAPLDVIATVSMARVLERPAMFARSLVLGATLLLLAGAVAAWLISRSLTRPLGRLVSAAEAVSAGDYGHSVVVDRRDELGTLAAAFRDMVSHVRRANTDLQRQFEEATQLADRIETANAQLVDTMATAEDARRSAENASRAKSDFLATMSHEIRTPINAIIGYADLLGMEIPGPLTDEQARQVRRVRMSAVHLSTLVDEVLDLSRIEAGQLRLEDRTGVVGEVVEAAVAVVTPAAHQKGLDLVLACETNGTDFAGDPHRVRQILINLLSNAVKFTPEGGRIEVCSAIEPAARGEDEIVIRVSDSGCGIAPHQVETIFEPFVQGDVGYTRAHGGVGLGLSISRRLARMMGGEIEVDSEPGRGSTFTVRLRLAGVAEPAR